MVSVNLGFIIIIYIYGALKIFTVNGTAENILRTKVSRKDVLIILNDTAIVDLTIR